MTTISGLIQQTVVAVISWAMLLAIKAPQTRPWAMSKIRTWSNKKNGYGIFYSVCWNLRHEYAKYTSAKACEYCEWPLEEGHRHAYCEMWLKVQRMNSSDLLQIWDGLKVYDPSEFYDAKGGIKMDQWAEAVHSQITARNLDWYDDAICPEVGPYEFTEGPMGHHGYA